MEDVSVTKNITARANQKQWMTAEAYVLLTARNVAYKSGDVTPLKSAKVNQRPSDWLKEPMDKKSSATFMTTETLKGCGGEYKPSLTVVHHKPHH